MATQDRPLIVGIFESQGEAERAVNELRAEGFTDDQIGFAARSENGEETDTVTDHERRGGTREGLVMGAITGGAFGSIVGAAVAVLLPGIGPVIAGGILGAVLTGAAAGLVTGGLVGALREWGLPEEEARYYQGEFEAGRTVVTVLTGNPERQQAATAVVRRNNGYDASTRSRDMTGEAGTMRVAYADSAGYSATGVNADQFSGAAVFVPQHDQATDSVVQSRVSEWVGSDQAAEEPVMPGNESTHQTGVDTGRPG